MAHPFHIYRLSNAIKDVDAKHLEAARAALGEAQKVLRNCSVVDTFAGRKTQEPFPKEDDQQV